GWKLPTGFSGRLAHAEEEPRVYLGGRGVVGAGNWGEHGYLHHYQRGFSPPPTGRGALPAGGSVYPRQLNSRCEYQPPGDWYLAAQLRGLPRPKHRFHRAGNRNLSPSPELGRPSGTATTERLPGERKLLRRAGREALSWPHVCLRWRQEDWRQSGGGAELQPVGAAIRFRSQYDWPNHHSECHGLHGRGHRAAEFQRNRVAWPPRPALDPHQHARLCADRAA